MGLIIDKYKTIYTLKLAVAKNNPVVNGYSFEQVTKFKYLGVNTNKENNLHNEISLRMRTVNGCFYIMKKIFSSKLLSRRTKQRFYSTHGLARKEIKKNLQVSKRKFGENLWIPVR